MKGQFLISLVMSPTAKIFGNSPNLLKIKVKASLVTKIDGMMERAASLHRSGKVEEARELYRQVLLHAPDFAEALHRLGLIRPCGKAAG